jgi:hypothetical protein
MCLVKVKDFGDALGISGGTIRSKISRGQLLRNKNNLIDTENPTNYIYLLEVNGGDQKVFEPYDIKPNGRANVSKKVSPPNKNATNVVVSKKQVSNLIKSPINSKKEVLAKPSKTNGSVNIAPSVETKISKLTLEEKFERELAKQQRQTLLEIDIAQKKANLNNVQRTAEIKQMQLEKIMGNTLPLDQVMSIMAINYKAIFKSFHAQLKNIASTMVQNLGGTKDDLNAIMIELEQSLNHIKETAKENSNDDIERLVEEYSQIRSRGERH